MSIDRLTDLHSQLIDGGSVSASDEASLLDRLKQCSMSRSDVLQDEAVDNQLRCLARLDDETANERFISETMRRVRGSKRTVYSASGFARSRPGRRGNRRSSNWKAVLSVAAIIPIAVAILGGLLWMNADASKIGSGGLAQLRNLDGAVWKGENLRDAARLGADAMTLLEGKAEIRFDEGAVVELTAPTRIEIVDPGMMVLYVGRCDIRVPPQAIGFAVKTPTAKIVDLGTEFDVTVSDEGRTRATVRLGEIEVVPGTDRSESDVPINLAVGGLTSAEIAIDYRSDGSPLVATARGERGQFFGVVSSNGKSVEFHSRTEFEDFRNRMDNERTVGTPEQTSNATTETWSNGSRATTQSSVTSGDFGDSPSSGQPESDSEGAAEDP